MIEMWCLIISPDLANTNHEFIQVQDDQAAIG
jgi:hypothetical protein